MSPKGSVLPLRRNGEFGVTLGCHCTSTILSLVDFSSKSQIRLHWQRARNARQISSLAAQFLQNLYISIMGDAARFRS
jgi:hypothetical protein